MVADFIELLPFIVIDNIVDIGRAVIPVKDSLKY